MGNRVKGRVKKKSIRVALSSKAGSKRKLSRMGKKQKKEHAGLEATFIGRSRCIKILQVTIKDFRRLCILKGIYPREPHGRVPGKKKGQTFYHIKDIKALAHEPILEKFREFRSFMKKVRRAAGRNEIDEAARKNSLVPTYTLNHLVKERYPRFVDALGDLDDALTLTFLFAALPSNCGVPPKAIGQAKSHAAAWGAYCATTSAISKSFISVKGIYMEAAIHGIPVRWIVPHAFTQHIPDDVDFRVMKSFLEFYSTLLNFVMYKLYNDIGVRYPLSPQDTEGQTIGSTTSVLGANLRLLRKALDNVKGGISNTVTESLKKNDSAVNTARSAVVKNSSAKHNEKLEKAVGDALSNLKGADDVDDEDAPSDQGDDESVDVAGPLKMALEKVAEEETRSSLPSSQSGAVDENLRRRSLFQGLTFFLSREVPRGYLELICLAYGGKVGWEGDESPISIKDSSITHHVVDRSMLPSSYDSLPKSREFIQPQWIVDCTNFMFILPVAKYSIGATLPPHLSPWVDDEEEGYKPAYAEEIERLKNGEVVEDSMDNDGIDEVSDDSEIMERAADKSNSQDTVNNHIDDESTDEDDDGNEKHKERKEKKRKSESDEAHLMAKSMMGRKALHLYERMQHGITQKKAKVENLRQRRKEIESSKKRDSSGKTPLKQKVERLKEERKSIEQSYGETGGTMKKAKKR